MSRSHPPTPEPRSRLPRRQRWLQPLLALAGLSSLSPLAPARTLDAAPVVARAQDLRARLLAAGPAAAAVDAAAADPQLALWQKWNDWNNWAKWGKK